MKKEAPPNPWTLNTLPPNVQYKIGEQAIELIFGKKPETEDECKALWPILTVLEVIQEGKIEQAID